MAYIKASINVSKLNRLLKTHTELQKKSKKAENKDIFTNVTIWINDGVDKYDNDSSIQVSKDEKSQITDDLYIGNGRTNTLLKQQEIEREKKKAAEAAKLNAPNVIETTATGETPAPPVEQSDDLPF